VSFSRTSADMSASDNSDILKGSGFRQKGRAGQTKYEDHSGVTLYTRVIFLRHRELLWRSILRITSLKHSFCLEHDGHWTSEKFLDHGITKWAPRRCRSHLGLSENRSEEPKCFSRTSEWDNHYCDKGSSPQFNLAFRIPEGHAVVEHEFCILAWTP